MHLALVTHYYAPEVGAPQRRWAAFVERFVAAGHRVTVLAPSPHYPEGLAGELEPDLRPGATVAGAYGETIHRLRFREHTAGLSSRSADQVVTATHAVMHGARTLARRADRPDVVLATVPGIPSIAAGRALASLLRRPLVVEMRDAWPDLIAPSGMWGPDVSQGWRTRATRAMHELMTGLQRHADAVVTTTDAFADVLRARGMKRIDVIRNGVVAARAPLLAPPPLESDRLRVLYLGTMGRSQGLGAAVRAARAVQDRGIPISLRLVGGGADEAYLRGEAASLDAPVEFWGHVAPDTVLEHYEWADTAIVSLRDWEPFAWTVPSKLYEILAVGRHVSAALVGESAQVVRDTGAGTVVLPQSDEALADLWSGLWLDRSRLDVGDGGHRWVREHADHDALAARYLKLLEEVVA